jgi:tRNA A-37 threonylcarbamoyl transferase component Bud32
MNLATGAMLGPYELLSLLGKGGMGEVYRARDTRLDRTVAVKVLPQHLSSSPERRQRFEREARAVSSLSHPHICALYDVGRQDGIDYLVMEYIEGESLADRLSKGPLPVDQALRYSIQVANALDKAHRSGIVHRDLKPANIMLTKSGAKLLDFGLAKLRGNSSEAAPSLTSLPTERVSITAEGTILGTFQYMAPEQLEGREADARTDIFAFGAVVYEMATGKRAFNGKSQASLITAIMSADPQPISELQPMSPPALDRIVKRCLGKDPDERWQTAHDLMEELKWVAEAGSQAGAAAPVAARRKIRERGWMIATVVFFLAAGLLAVAYFRRAPVETAAAATRFFIYPPEKVSFTGTFAISPDGRRIVFRGTSEGKTLLWVRALDSLSAQPLAGTQEALFPFWSPDSRFIGFYSSGKLKKIEATGGPAQPLCDAPLGAQGAWNRDNVIVFAPNFADALYRVSAAGGAPVPLTTLDASRKETAHVLPNFLPDGRHFIYLVTNAQRENTGIYVGSLDSKETKLLVNTYQGAAYAPPGYLLFMRERTLMAQSFDADRLELKGEPFPVAEQVDLQLSAEPRFASFSVSETGALVYRSGSRRNYQLTWFDREGKQLGTIGPPGAYGNPWLSPDEKRVTVELAELLGQGGAPTSG